MDRVFAIQKAFLETLEYDGKIIEYAMQKLCSRNIDLYVIIDEPIFDEDYVRETYPDLVRNKKIIPVGSVNLSTNWLEAKGKNMAPIEIPPSMQMYCRRSYTQKYGRDITEEEMDPKKYFLKDIDRLKSWNSSLCLTPDQVREHIKDTTKYSISKYVEFDSEWRVFVYNNEAIGAECYQGWAGEFPDRTLVCNMIAAYNIEPHPKAYTLDVGVRTISGHGIVITDPIEVHPFVSCGLYGFYDNKLLDMIEAGYDWYIREV